MMNMDSKATDSTKDCDHNWEVKANDRSFHNKFKEKRFLCFQKNKYADNIIKTSKYNALNFIPLNLYEQYHHPHVVYFTFILLLQCVPQIATMPVYIFVLPLSCILVARALRDLGNDIARHRSDNLVNNKSCEILRGKTFQMLKWKDIQVGDIVCLRKDEFIPADMLLLYSTEPNSMCYVETTGIDGETNLKFRQSLSATHCALQTPEALSQFDGLVTCEPPNSVLHSFVGVLSWKNRKYPLNNDNLLLRDCRVRNTALCYGLVIYAGCDTKIMKNSGKVTMKQSKVDVVIGRSVISIAVILSCVTLVLALGAGVWNAWYITKYSYIPSNPRMSSSSLGFFTFWAYFTMLSTLVPFLLYISMELMYHIHNYYIKQDLEMYQAESDNPAQAKGNRLCDLLGQVDFIFTDKTGTLTQNVMTFKKCCIGHRVFGLTSNEERDHQEVSFAWNRFADPSFRFYDESLCKEIRSSQDPLLHEFFRAISLCHTVMSDTGEGILVYKAASPDEEALVTAARNFGYAFLSRTQDSITVSERGEERTYSILALLDFTSSRKRMSVLVRDEDGKIKLYTKGADSVVLQRVHPGCQTGTFMDVLDQFAEETLRTLCLAYREVEEKEYTSWKLQHEEASVTLNNREDSLEKVYEDIEKDLQLLGATAIEDKLQEGVPETIQLLRDASMKIWMLTGDKQETAVNIAFSCNLLSSDLQIIDENDLRLLLDGGDDSGVKESEVGITGDQSSGKALVITGDFLSTLTHLSEPQDLPTWKKLLMAFRRKKVSDLDPRTRALVDLACQYQAVICCRMTPKQKASIVQLVKTNKKVITLAIGDGGNDVNMLKTAHLGVGVIGKEGTQAVLASDFALAQFSFLQNLLFFHGRLSYLRTSRFLCFYNYKTFASLFHNFWFGFFNGFSALNVSDSWFLLFNAILFTVLPAYYVGMVDKDFDSKTSLRHPRLYVQGRRDSNLLGRIFLHILYGIYTSLVMFFVAYFGFYDSAGPGGIFDYQVFACSMTNMYFLAVIAEALMTISSYNYLVLLAIGFSFFTYFLISILSTLPGAFFTNMMYFNFLGAMMSSVSSGYLWLLFLLGTFVSILPSLFCRLWYRLSSPSMKQLVTADKKRTARPRAFSRSSTRRRSSYAFSHTEGFARFVPKRENLQNMQLQENVKF